MKKPTNEEFIRAYMSAWNQRLGFADVVRSFAEYGESVYDGEYKRLYNIKCQLQNSGVRLPEFKVRRETPEVRKLNELVESLKEE
jgi:hypothetical protein